MRHLRAGALSLGFMLAGCLPATGEGVRILNFDKQLSGTDKMIFISPPPGQTWSITAASVSTDTLIEGVMFHAWLEDAPFRPYRNPFTGELVGCIRCVDVVVASAASNYFFPIVGGYSDTGLRGQSQPIELTGPSRLGLAFTPAHGGLPQPMQVYVRLQIKVQ